MMFSQSPQCPDHPVHTPTVPPLPSPPARPYTPLLLLCRAIHSFEVTARRVFGDTFNFFLSDSHPHRHHGSQHQHVQSAPADAPRPPGRLRSHRHSRRPGLNDQGQPGHHVRGAPQRRHHQRPLPGHDRAVLHQRLRGRHTLPGRGRGGRGAGAGRHHSHRHRSLPGSICPPRPHRHHTEEVHRILE